MKVTLKLDPNTNTVTRDVKEDMGQARDDQEVKARLCSSGSGRDGEMEQLEATMKNYQAEYAKSHDELAEIYCQVSGQMNKVRDYLNLERQFLKKQNTVSSNMSTNSKPGNLTLPKAYLRDNGIITWSTLEDFALKKPETSVEFQVLMQTKGAHEIM